MSKFADQLRTLKVFNNWELIYRFGTTDDVVIEYRRPASGRLGWCDTHRTSVWSSIKTNKLPVPKQHLSTTPSEKEFYGLRSQSFPEALRWAGATFGHTYVPSPFGGHVPQHVLKKAKAAVKNIPPNNPSML